MLTGYCFDRCSEVVVSTRESASAGNENASEDYAKWSLALHRLTEALSLLDEGDAPPQLGAQLDLVIQRLKTAIAGTTQRNS
jgi:hypothetical protein